MKKLRQMLKTHADRLNRLLPDCIPCDLVAVLLLTTLLTSDPLESPLRTLLVLWFLTYIPLRAYKHISTLPADWQEQAKRQIHLLLERLNTRDHTSGK